MITCPNCGSQNNEGDRFCSSCGTNLEHVTNGDPATSNVPETNESFPQRPSGIPPPVSFAPSPGASVEEEWRMSSLGPPPSRKRSIWVWILIGVIALCLLSCVGLIAFSLTDTGQRWIEDLATEAAIQATEAADGD